MHQYWCCNEQICHKYSCRQLKRLSCLAKHNFHIQAKCCWMFFFSLKANRYPHTHIYSVTKPYLENQIIPANRQENRGFQCPKHGAFNRIQDSWIAQWRSRWSTTNDGWRYMQLFLWLRRHERFIVSGRLAIESSGPRPSLTPRSFFPIFSYRRW